MVFRASVENVIRIPPVTALVSESVLSVTEKMTSNKIGAVIILFEGVLQGIITERDIVEKIVTRERDPKKVRAQDIMTSPVIALEANKSVGDALKLMRRRNIRRLVVTRKGKLVGIVTERRLLDSLAKIIY